MNAPRTASATRTKMPLGYSSATSLVISFGTRWSMSPERMSVGTCGNSSCRGAMGGDAVASPTTDTHARRSRRAQPSPRPQKTERSTRAEARRLQHRTAAGASPPGPTSSSVRLCRRRPLHAPRQPKRKSGRRCCFQPEVLLCAEPQERRGVALPQGCGRSKDLPGVDPILGTDSLARRKVLMNRRAQMAYEKSHLGSV
jgi:hypothetical protein